MSPRKLTEDDKQEILQLYRNSEATTSTLADRYEVSSSTISRFLKNKLSSTEYEDLIQQKRLARTPRGEKTSAKTEKKEKVTKAKKTRKKSSSKVKAQTSETTLISTDIEPAELVQPVVAETEAESKPLPNRRRRRRSSASDELELSQTVANAVETEAEPVQAAEETMVDQEEKKPAKLVIDKRAKETGDIFNSDADLDKPSKTNSLILKNERFEIEEDEDDDEVDLITLKEMLGEDLQDINDEDDDEDDDDWEDENEQTLTYSRKESGFSDVEILPLSQATFPRTCYLVIDRSAELIVKPLADFADLGEIPQNEVRERTLPVFDNHRIAKRFSHRRERVIKVPDGRILQKTSRHLQEKGITRLLIDGQIYSLSS